MSDIYSDIASQLGMFTQPTDALREQGVSPPSKEQLDKIKTAMEEQGLNPEDHVDFSPEAMAKAMEFVQKSEDSPQSDLKQQPEGDQKQGAKAQAGGTGIAGGVGATDSSEESDDIEELEEEIEELEQEIRELQGKTDEQSKTKLEQKQQELSAKQVELAQLQSNEA
ncbi:hypothetical protein [Desulfovibrio ferrophilus]|uniref:Uncharacterized protein n=1 Tax=Desulfovibrio ferrophilus TaxID=241368 RepID=A0A2Z6AWI0_9BACT|nr:hypothetical protein [Desulfovibrio ferrophilus]BBD07581.1 uncharacterized protein DFE_0855 [Desulfovibrio ferrophilus]